MSNSLWPHKCRKPGLPVHHQLLVFNQTHGHWVNDNHPTISSSIIPFSSCLQSFPASGSFQMSQIFASGGQSTGVSAWASVLPMNIEDWFPLGWGNNQGIRKKGKNELHKSHLKSTELELGEEAAMWFWEKTYKIILTTPFVLERTIGLTALPVWS